MYDFDLFKETVKSDIEREEQKFQQILDEVDVFYKKSIDTDNDDLKSLYDFRMKYAQYEAREQRKVLSSLYELDRNL